MLGLIGGLLLAGVVLACLFSFLLPASASILAPTVTPTRTPRPTATLAPTATITWTPFPTSTLDPAWFATPNMTLFPGFKVFESRELWEAAIGGSVFMEDFEQDTASYEELNFPYLTGHGFVLAGTSHGQILRSPGLLPSQNYLHFVDFETGLAVTLPTSTMTTAVSFDYTTHEDWQLSVLNIGIVLSRGENRFVGVVLYEKTLKEFRLIGPQTSQGGLSIDNIGYAP